MPWSDNRLPKYGKHRASGQAVVTLNGRDFYLGPHGTKASNIEYDRLLGEWLASGRNPLCASADELTVVELCARYFKFAKGHYQKDGQCSKALPGLKCALRYLRERYGRQPAVGFGPLALKALRQQMVGDNLSRRYINDHVEKIKRMFKWAVGEQLLPAAVYQALRAVEGLRKTGLCLSGPRLKRYFSASWQETLSATVFDLATANRSGVLNSTRSEERH